MGEARKLGCWTLGLDLDLRQVSTWEVRIQAGAAGNCFPPPLQTGPTGGCSGPHPQYPGLSDIRCPYCTPACRGEEKGSRLWATQRKPEIHGPKGLGGNLPAVAMGVGRKVG